MEKLDVPPRRPLYLLRLITGGLFALLVGSVIITSYFRPTSPEKILPDRFALESSSNGAELAQGRENLAVILTAAADYLKSISKEHDLQALDGLGDDLMWHAKDAHSSSLINSASVALHKRGFLDSIGSALGGGGDAAAGASSTSTSSSSGIFSGLLSSIGTMALDSLAEPAMYLGNGLGTGATAGLNLSSNVQTMPAKPTGVDAVANNLGYGLTKGLVGSINLSSVAPDPSTIGNAASALAMGVGGGAAYGLKLNSTAIPNPNMTGISLVAKNFGDGLTGSFLGSVNLSSLAGQNINTAQISTAVVSAGKGLGEGAAQGLSLSTMNTTTTAARLRKRAAAAAAGNSSGFDVGGVAEDFTRSLSSSFLGMVDLKSLASSFMSSNSTSMMSISGMVGPAIAAAGSGLGHGAAVGLGYQDAPAASAASTDVPTIARDFTFGLSSNFLYNGTISKLASSLGGAASGSTMNIQAMLGPAAEGAGSGLGEGVAVGLGLQVAPAPTEQNASIAMTVKGFAYGLTSSLLANNTLSKLTSSSSSLFGSGNSSDSSSALGFSLQSVSISKAVEGLARGLVDGAGSSIGSSTGSVSLMAASANDAAFNDTVGGAATGFGRGLGSGGTTLVINAFSKTPLMAPPSSSSSAVATRDLATLRRRSLDTSLLIAGLSKRATVSTADIFANLNITMVDGVIQTGADSLTCQGIGGFLSVALGLVSSKTINISNVTIPKAGTLPNTTFTIRNDGNEFVVNPGTLDIKVNGMGVIKFAVLLVLHIILMIFLYFIAIPIALFLEHGHAISILINRPRWAKAPRWALYIWISAAPIALIGFVFGVVIIGNGKQFVTSHGIIGLVALLSTFVASALEVPMLKRIPGLKLPRWINLALLLALGKVLFVTGFADLGRVSFCATNAIIPAAGWIVITMVLDLNFVVAITVVGVRFLLAKWLGGAKRTSSVFGDGSFVGGKVEGKA